MTWKPEEPGSMGEGTYVTQYINGVISRTLSLQGFIEYTNELEQALLIAVADPKLINVLHNAVNKS